MRHSPVSGNAQLEHRIGASEQINRQLNTVGGSMTLETGVHRSMGRGINTDWRIREGSVSAGIRCSICIRTCLHPSDLIDSLCPAAAGIFESEGLF